MPMENMLAPLQGMQQQKLRVGKNPNPQFPRLRNAWENTKDQSWLSALKGLLGGAGSGAATGAALGSFFPGVGTAIGAGIGAGIGGFGGGALGLSEGAREGASNFALGTPGHVEQTQNFTPEQQSIMQLLQQLGAFGLQNPTAGFEPIEQQARNQFQQHTVPGIAERFTSMGAGNALSSGTFNSQLGQAGAGLEGDISAQKAQFGQQNMQQLLQMLQLALQPQFENSYRPREAGALEELGKAGLKNIGGIWDVRQKAKALQALTPTPKP